ncbi:MAG: helix-turn-helix transcriptional regulator [Clostridia bacterium]|nr:helix-turn-helix transcriptional regulator [Clostridia bacterium]
MSESGGKVSLGTMKVEYRKDSPKCESFAFSGCTELYRIIFVTGGEAVLTLEGRELTLSRDSAILLLPLGYYSVRVAPDTVFETYTVSFSRDAVFGYARELLSTLLGDNEEKELSRVFDFGKMSREIISTLERADISDSLPERERRVYLSSLLCELVAFLSATSSEPALPDDSDFAVRVMQFVNENIKGEMSLDKISRYFFVSKFYLCRAFKARFGISVHEYITTKRIMLSRQLISAGETASAAAYKVGFGDYSSFYRAYRKVVGEVPARLNQRRDSK